MAVPEQLGTDGAGPVTSHTKRGCELMSNVTMDTTQIGFNMIISVRITAAQFRLPCCITTRITEHMWQRRF